jgi:hypothetical protein
MLESDEEALKAITKITIDCFLSYETLEQIYELCDYTLAKIEKASKIGGESGYFYFLSCLLEEISETRSVLHIHETCKEYKSRIL